MSWHFSRALVEEYSGAYCSGGEPCAPLKLTPTPAAYYWPDKTTGHSRLSRFGMTSEPLTAPHGEALLMWYLAGSRAKTLAQPEAERGLMVNGADCGRRWLASFAKYDPALRLWRTAQCSLLADSDGYSETWPRWGSMRDGECSEQTMLVHPTDVNESGLWPTPNASDHIQRKTSASWKAKGRVNFVLSNPEITGVSGGMLNPEWTEWLMGWPIGWTDLKPLETDKSRSAPQPHGESLLEACE